MRVKCIKLRENGWWWSREYVRKFFFLKKLEHRRERGPKYGDVVTVEGEGWYQGKKYYSFIEWPGSGAFISDEFKPIDEQKADYKEVKFNKIKESAPSEN